MLVEKAYQKTGMFERCFSGFSKHKLTVLYTSVLRPVLEYASTVWNPWLVKDTTKLEKVQRKCLKLTAGEVELEFLKSRRNKKEQSEIADPCQNLFCVVYFVWENKWKDISNERSNFFVVNVYRSKV